MTKKQRGWFRSSKRTSKPKVPASTKEMVKTRADELIETVLKPKYVTPPPEGMIYNYVVDVYTKWYRNYFYFCAKYACPHPNAISSHFETKFARMEYVAHDCYHMSYLRHNDKWAEIFYSLSLDECFKNVQENPTFML